MPSVSQELAMKVLEMQDAPEDVKELARMVIRGSETKQHLRGMSLNPMATDFLDWLENQPVPELPKPESSPEP